MQFRSALVALGLLTACATAPQPFSVEGPLETPAGPSVSALVATGRARVEAFFGHAFPAPVHVVIAPTRSALDSALPPEWQVTPTQCWMVGVGAADMLAMLSPAAWSTEACEHDGQNAAHIQEIVTHELTHVFHGQHNPTRDFIGMDDAGWFVEGLAVLVAGQLDSGNRPSAAEAIAKNAAPERLADAWSGKYRYGVTGSMVAFIDAIWGRAKLLDLLQATTNDQILANLGLTEAEFLSRWRTWVVRS